MGRLTAAPRGVLGIINDRKTTESGFIEPPIYDVIVKTIGETYQSQKPDIMQCIYWARETVPDGNKIVSLLIHRV